MPGFQEWVHVCPPGPARRPQMNKQTIRLMSLGLFAIGCMLAPPWASLRAQSTFGTVRGSSLDQSGGAVPGAAITLHSLDENSNVTAIGNDHGTFEFENLKPGHYAITAAKEGFATTAVDHLELAARQTLRVDVTLAVASQSQSVEVSASGQAVNTENATLADSKNNHDITAL